MRDRLEGELQGMAEKSEIACCFRDFCLLLSEMASEGDDVCIDFLAAGGGSRGGHIRE